MVDLRSIAVKFNKEIVSFRPDCYALVDEDEGILAVWLDGRAVIKIDANLQINVLLKPGFTAYKVLKECFPNEG